MKSSPQSTHSEQPAKADGATLPLRRRADLMVEEIGFGGRLSFVVKDPLALKYHRLQPVQMHLLNLLSEPRTVAQLQLALNAFAPASQFERRDVQQMLADFHEKRLVTSSRPGQGQQLLKLRHKQFRQQLKKTLQSVLFMKLPGWSPTGVLNLLEPLRRWILHPLSIAMMAMVILAGLLLVTREAAEFQRRLPEFQQFFTAANLPYLWVSIVVAKIVHELGHAIVCRHFGATPHQIGVMLLVFMPTMYCDVTDSWLLKNKWQRMAIGLAGPFFESVLAAAALFFWWWTVPGVVHFVCLNLFLVSAITTVVFNLNPLIRFDGYYVLSDYLEIPNLKQQSDRALQAAFCRSGLGVELPRDPILPETGNRWLLVYGVAAWCYRWLIMLGITMFIYSLLKPWGLERFAFLLLAFTLGMMLYGMGRGMWQALKQIQPVRPSLGRYTLLGGTGAAVLAGLLWIPIPYWITCGFELEPQSARPLHVITPGFLEEVFVEPGCRVEAGDLLIRLRNPDLETELLTARMDCERLETTLQVARLKRDDEQIAMLADQLNSVHERIDNLKQRTAQLAIVAPTAGRLFPAEAKATQQARPHERLPQWSGTIFETGNMDAWLETGTPLVTLAPDDDLQAVLVIDQAHRNDLSTGQSVLLQCEPWSGQYLAGQIEQIAARETRQAPRALSEKAGGELTTITDERGGEQLLSAAYRGIVPLPPDAGIPSHFLGSTGTARVMISHRTAVQWGWRQLCQTFQFRL